MTNVTKTLFLYFILNILIILKKEKTRTYAPSKPPENVLTLIGTANMKDFDLTNANGYLNVEVRTDGGVGIYVESPAATLALSKDETLKLAAWLMQHIEENIKIVWKVG